MEEKKLGMGWYEFLRYFTFGLGRFISGFLMIISLLLIFVYPSIIEILSFILSAIAFVLSLAIHNHLEKYSDKIVALFGFNFIIDFINNIVVNIGENGIYNMIPALLVTTAFYLINRKYFKNRSHIFINKCNFWGKKLEVSPSEPKTFKFCRICGRKLDITDKFCPGCGTKVIETEE